MQKLAALVAGLMLAALMIGCGNANDNTANTNANTNTVANTNTNTNANANTNTRKAPTKEDVEKNKETYGKEAKSAGRTIGAGASDTWLWVKAKYDLAAADDLRDSTINVDVDNGVITLTGTVASQDQVKKADQIAKAVDGVKSVKNMLKASAGAGSNSNANKSANSNASPAKK
jgi:hyperosmotically inducible protein